MKPETTKDTIYKVTRYDGEKITTVAMNREQLQEIDSQSVDYYLSLAFGGWGYRNSKGQWITKNLDCSGLGNTCLEILIAVQNAPGEYLTPKEIKMQTGIYSMETPNNLSARWMSLRRVHGETFNRPNFFLSRRTGGMGICWSRKRTWMRIERLSHSVSH
jgi:hypothetical protein